MFMFMQSLNDKLIMHNHQPYNAVPCTYIMQVHLYTHTLRYTLQRNQNDIVIINAFPHFPQYQH